jgi:iron(III) transport system substrate-binding protein
MKRWYIVFTLALSMVIFLSPCTPQAASSTNELYQAAKKAGETEVVLTQGLTAPAGVKSFVDSFEKAFPGIKLIISRLTPTEQAQRIVTEAAAKRTTIDIVTMDLSAGTPAWDRDLLQTLDLTGTGIDPNDVAMNNRAVFASAGSTAMIYNKNLIADKDLPKKWEDLLDPKWRGKIGFSNTGGGFQPLNIWDEAKIETYLQALGKQQGPVYPTSVAIAEAVARGEVLMAPMAAIETAATSWKAGAPLAILPIFPIYSGPHYFSIVKNNPHPNAAKLFIAWLGTQEAKQGMVAAEWGRVKICGPRPMEQMLCNTGVTFIYEDSLAVVKKSANIRALAVKYVVNAGK